MGDKKKTGHSIHELTTDITNGKTDVSHSYGATLCINGHSANINLRGDILVIKKITALIDGYLSNLKNNIKE